MHCCIKPLDPLFFNENGVVLSCFSLLSLRNRKRDMGFKFLSFTIAVSRQFSSRPSVFGNKKGNWSKSKSKSFFFFKNRKKSCGTGTGFNKGVKKTEIKWTDEQQGVLDAVSNRKSVFITGSAGTGKTFLLEDIIKKLKKVHGKSGVYVTAPTGVAACALQGQTLHSFSGIGFAEGDREVLLDRVLLDKRACSRWRKVKALIIDEISMVDAGLFDGLSYIARKIRGEEKSEDENKTWGGIQLIVSGDFFQLPPVIKKKKKKQKVYAFEADSWNSSFDYQIELKVIFRQSEALLIQLLQGIRKGEPDPDDVRLLKECCSGFDADPEAVRLYPRIADVNKVNTEKLDTLKEEIHLYTCQDHGKQPWLSQLKSGIAPDELKLCVGARVILTKNVKPWQKLVNGATGTVTEFVEVSEDKYELSDMCSHGSLLPVVKFDFGLELVVEPEVFVVMDGDKVVAMRRQIPLILSWAISIHKCQGMTLEKLATDLSRVFDFGMVYVAISRVKRLSGLHLSGLNSSKIKAHPGVLEFYRNFNVEKDEKKKIQ